MPSHNRPDHQPHDTPERGRNPYEGRDFVTEFLASAERELLRRRGEASAVEAALGRHLQEIAVIEADVRHLKRRQRSARRRILRCRALRAANTATRVTLVIFGFFSFTVASILFINGLPGSTEMFSAAASAWAAAIALPPVR
ncbi:hypothetical protein OHB35_52990 [Streptomyces phaeochromogenes]|uniref:Uncharacterized protein n=1 Tax=Streptomyces phaeochromogenes TaxID=1923 RepID=A0ABZ1HSP8_STRPH|nr:hypothetical protein [Streptomyces phaeochromogenes]WSD21260.1 hypothetical protein OHB35_52990 [Streptomyces phaeochromogenes]